MMHLFLDNLKIIVSGLFAVFAIIHSVITIFSRSPIVQFLQPRHQQLKEEWLRIVIVSLVFSLAVTMFMLGEAPVLPELQGESRKLFVYVLLFVWLALFLILLLIWGMVSWKRPASNWLQATLKVTMIIAYFATALQPFLVAGLLDGAAINQESILSITIVLWIIYVLILFSVYDSNNHLTPKQAGYQMIDMNDIDINDMYINKKDINELYLVTVLDHDRVILADIEDFEKKYFFTPFYIYNYTTKTLHMIELADRLTTKKPRRHL